MFWQWNYYVGLALPFGLRLTQGIFNCVVDLLHWCLVNNRDFLDLLHDLISTMSTNVTRGLRPNGLQVLRMKNSFL